MKNLLVFTGPKQQFDEETATLAKIQIDNSFDVGWQKEDIVLVTDFPYAYNGVQAHVVKRGLYYDFDLAASKIPIIVHLIQQGIVDPGQVYWSHDFDAYELHKITEAELGLEAFDLGLTHYFYKPEWQLGSFFFKETAQDIFALVDQTIRTRPYRSRNNEKTVTRLIRDNAIAETRYKKMNVTYNITKRCLQTVVREATLPIKVLHFHPWDKDAMMPDTALNMFMYGKNSLKRPLMTDRLIKIFHLHGIK